MTETVVPLDVRLVESAVPLGPGVIRDRNATFSANTLTDASLPACVLGHAPSRKNALVIVTGGAGATVVIGGDRSDVQNGRGAVIPTGLPALVLTTTGEVWAGSVSTGGTVTVSVIAEYGDR